MTTSVSSPYTSEQITAWHRGLLTIAWADGDFDAEEQALIQALVKDELSLGVDPEHLEPIDPKDLATMLGQDPAIAENFLRTAVMVALADGIYTTPEDKLIQQFSEALGQETAALGSLRTTLEDKATGVSPSGEGFDTRPDVLHPVRDWLDGLEIEDPRLARFLCKLIPDQCPFERDIKLFGHKVVHIPPLCKLNPLYEQLVGLRFRALSYLADECLEDVSRYFRASS